VSDVGVVESTGCAVAVRVTGTTSGLFDAPAAVIVIVPSYVPAASPAGLTDTLRLAGVVPLSGLTDNHVLPDGVCTLAAAVKLNGAPLLATASGCAAGRLSTMCYRNVSDVGVVESTGCAVTVSVTGTFSGLFEASALVMVIVPL